MSKSIYDLKVGQTLTIGNATVRLERKSGQLARLVVDAPSEMAVNLTKDKSAHECMTSLLEKYSHG